MDMGKFTKYYLPVLVWMTVIFLFSSIPGSDQRGEPTFWFYAERKGAHIFEFFVLTILFGRVFWSQGIRSTFLYFSSALFALLFAVSDEIHQLFVFGREGKPLDVLIDSAGIILAVIILVAVLDRKGRG